MQLNIQQADQKCTIAINTVLDAVSVLELSNAFHRAAAELFDEITVDMTNVAFMDPSGLGLLVSVQKRQLENHGGFRLKGLNGQPAEMVAQSLPRNCVEH